MVLLASSPSLRRDVDDFLLDEGESSCECRDRTIPSVCEDFSRRRPSSWNHRSMAAPVVWTFIALAMLVSFGGVHGQSGCEFAFFPNTVNSQLGIKQMTVNRTSDVQTLLTSDPVQSVRVYTFKFVGRLMKALNPRLCRWVVTENKEMKLWFPENDITRKSLAKENGLPSVTCMMDEKTPGVTVSLYPKFARSGVIMPSANSAAQGLPLCGDLFWFRKRTLLMFDGVVEAGTIKILECQSGEEKDINDYVMFPLFQANCTATPPALVYPPPAGAVSGKA